MSSDNTPNEVAQQQSGLPPRPASPSTPPLPTGPAAGDSDARATGRRRSKSFYGKENSVPTPQKAGGIERKNTAVDLQSIILRATLKENISKEIDVLKLNGTYQELDEPGDLDTFEQQATEVLKKKAEEIKLMRFGMLQWPSLLFLKSPLFRHSASCILPSMPAQVCIPLTCLHIVGKRPKGRFCCDTPFYYKSTSRKRRRTKTGSTRANST
jgi:hypothetical protein